MKRYMVLFLCALLAFGIIAGCGDSKGKEQFSFIATVIEKGESYILVEPDEGSSELNSADKISVSIGDATIIDDEGKDITIQDIDEGDKVKIHYDGQIAESYPAQIHRCHRIVLVK
ncbi:MAG TPA: DUF3221 domain-containing protein [Clostridia bacterium]|nr:DUF3221 domain-containing protein [Clostridia bacterium]